MNSKLRSVMLVVVAMLNVGVADEAPNFQRDVRPILSEHCFRCHGFDENARQARLRLDEFDGATRPAESGRAAVVPGKPEASELLRRVRSDDLDLRMPPAETGKRLSLEQIETLRRWIASGAKFSKHWSFERPVSSRPPDVRQRDWPRNVIDRFVLSRLEQSSLRPQVEADAARLLRRVSLDLTGLPPSLDELDRFQHAAATDADAAYEAEVERLLSSPHFGERMAIDWLDAARFADTNGYFSDLPRQAWPWRDWVIRAFNDNRPFDQFTIEQLAGDLLPNATRDQRVATGFHRNTMANNETGIIDEEYRVEMIADRVETTGTVWLGLTIGCAQCHDHKYDPISQREYFQLFAFFNQSVETGLVTPNDPPPTLEVPSDAQASALQRARTARESAEREFQSLSKSLDADLAAWTPLATKSLAEIPADAISTFAFEKNSEAVRKGVWNPLDAAKVSDKNSDDDRPKKVPDPFSDSFSAHVVGTSLQHERGIRDDAGKFDGTQHVELDSAFAADQAWTISVWLKPAASLACVCSKIEPTEPRRGVEVIWQKGRLQIHLVHQWGVDEIAVTTRDKMSANEWHHLLLSYDGRRRAEGLKVTIDGRDAPLNVQRDSLTGTLQNREPLRIGRRDSGLGYYGLLDEFRVLPRVVTAEESSGWSESERLRGILARSDERSAAEVTILREAFIAKHATPEVRDAHERLRTARLDEAAAKAAIPTTLVMQDVAAPRPTRVLIRGQYDKPGDEVQAGFPSSLIAPRSEALDRGAIHDNRPNRLALARWLVARDNPLTARVQVNRLWQMCFGEGLVRTPNDFGTQGELPTHPELLDELAVRFMESGWDVKALLRLIVTSATYRQESSECRVPSAVSSQQPRNSELDPRNSDPDNRLLARGPRFRLPAELLRDQALRVSGLFSPRIGGPSVKPLQPEGLWEEVSYNEEETYIPDFGEGLWRRSLYTFWKRQVPAPAMLTLDANTREKCVVRRSRTNTPLQALVLLNDETYVAAARALAATALKEHGTEEEKLRTLFRRVTSRWPESAELQVLGELLERQRMWVARPESSKGVDQDEPHALRKDSERATRNEQTAWMLVAQTILNLDEVITRR